MTIAFTTRSGTNHSAAARYEYFRHPSLNTNNWINERNGLPKNADQARPVRRARRRSDQFPGLYDGSGKAFFFFHYEELRFPNNFTKTRTIMNPATLDGTFFYNVRRRSGDRTSGERAAASRPAGGTGIDPARRSIPQVDEHPQPDQRRDAERRA